MNPGAAICVRRAGPQPPRGRAVKRPSSPCRRRLTRTIIACMPTPAPGPPFQRWRRGARARAAARGAPNAKPSSGIAARRCPPSRRRSMPRLGDVRRRRRRGAPVRAVAHAAGISGRSARRRRGCTPRPRSPARARGTRRCFATRQAHLASGRVWVDRSTRSAASQKYVAGAPPASRSVRLEISGSKTSARSSGGRQRGGEEAAAGCSTFSSDEKCVQ